MYALFKNQLQSPSWLMSSLLRNFYGVWSLAITFNKTGFYMRL